MKDLYISIVRSNLLYCSPLWRPYLIKDILNLERIQHRASKYILGDYISDYKTRLIKLNLLPLMYIYELLDILFFIKSYKSPINSFNIFQYVTFTNSFTRSRDKKLIHIASNNLVNSNSYFVEFLDFARFRYHFFTYCNKEQITWNHFLLNFSSNSNCSLHFLCLCNKCSLSPAISNFNLL